MHDYVVGAASTGDNAVLAMLENHAMVLAPPAGAKKVASHRRSPSFRTGTHRKNKGLYWSTQFLVYSGFRACLMSCVYTKVRAGSAFGLLALLAGFTYTPKCRLAQVFRPENQGAGSGFFELGCRQGPWRVRISLVAVLACAGFAHCAAFPIGLVKVPADDLEE